MPIVQTTKYKTSDGKLFDSEKSAELKQEELNNSSLASFNNGVYNKYIKSWADGRFDKETIDGVPPLSTLIKGIINKNLDRKLVDDALTTLFLYYSRQLIELVAQTAHAKEEAEFPIAGEQKVLEVAKKV